jgi:predicted lipid-binding transport protein (Tim44 family)
MERMMGGRQMGGGMGMGGGMMGGGMMGGMGGMLAGSLLASVAGGFIGSSIANSFFSNPSNEQGFQGSPEAAAVDGGVGDYNSGDFQETGLIPAPIRTATRKPECRTRARFQRRPVWRSGADGGFYDAGFDGGGRFRGRFRGGDF